MRIGGVGREYNTMKTSMKQRNLLVPYHEPKEGAVGIITKTLQEKRRW